MGIYKSYKRRFHLKNARLKKYQKNKQVNEEQSIGINKEASININKEAPSQLKDDLENGIINDFGLHELLLNNSDFLKEFEQFCIDDKLFIYNLLNLYNFVKTRDGSAQIT